MTTFQDQFLLNPSIHFLNHGSFGACPQPVFSAYQDWQRHLERQPVLFLGREIQAFQRQARRALADYLGAETDDMVFVLNATHGVNIVARSLDLQPGDEILASDHEYGACEYAWDLVCRKVGACFVRRGISLPLSSPEATAHAFLQGVTDRTRMIFISHITSPTALRLPVELICQQARQTGLLTLVDGAHAPGQIPLDLDQLGADFYTGNCHKWMLAPKGAGFLYARRKVQELIEPLVVSWGYAADERNSSGSRFIDLLEWTGTRDPSASLAVPDAIHFLETHDWPVVVARCSQMLDAALEEIGQVTGLPGLYPQGYGRAPQMACAALPSRVDPTVLKTRLYDEYQVEIPVTQWNGRAFLRISVQAYNTWQDLDALIQALKVLLKTAAQACGHDY